MAGKRMDCESDHLALTLSHGARVLISNVGTKVFTHQGYEDWMRDYTGSALPRRPSLRVGARSLPHGGSEEGATYSVRNRQAGFTRDDFILPGPRCVPVSGALSIQGLSDGCLLAGFVSCSYHPQELCPSCNLAILGKTTWHGTRKPAVEMWPEWKRWETRQCACAHACSMHPRGLLWSACTPTLSPPCSLSSCFLQGPFPSPLGWKEETGEDGLEVGQALPPSWD